MQLQMLKNVDRLLILILTFTSHPEPYNINGMLSEVQSEV